MLAFKYMYILIKDVVNNFHIYLAISFSSSFPQIIPCTKTFSAESHKNKLWIYVETPSYQIVKN